MKVGVVVGVAQREGNESELEKGRCIYRHVRGIGMSECVAVMQSIASGGRREISVVK